METPTTPIKKRRAPGMRWVRFWSLAKGTSFFAGRFVALKTGWCRYVVSLPLDHQTRRIYPWMKVRSCIPVKQSEPPYNREDLEKARLDCIANQPLGMLKSTCDYPQAGYDGRTRGNPQTVNQSSEPCPSA